MIGLWALACREPEPEQAPIAAVAAAPSVLVLVIDGVRTDEIVSAEVSPLTGEPGVATAPGLWSTLAPRALVARDMLATGATITAPAHAALLTGVPEAYANFPLDGGVGAYRPVHPTLFEAAREQLDLDADDAVLVANTALLEGLVGSVGTAFPGAWAGLEGDAADPGGDGRVFDALRARIDAGPPRVLVANLHDVDRAGHNLEAEDYAARVARVDAQIAALWEYAEATRPAWAASLLLVVTADHGRHRSDAPDAWHNHGDACYGCRETPLFVVGGTETGERAQAPLALDLAPTLAAHLGVALPWAEGLPLFSGVARAGEASAVVSGDMVATRRWRDDPLARSEIVVEGAVLSTPDALDTAAPAVLDASFGRVACWRELTRRADDAPWRPRCVLDAGAGWTDLGFPVDALGPYDTLALAARDGRLVAAWSENPTGAADAAEAALARAEWDGAWTTPERVAAPFPTDVALVGGDSPVAAVATNLDGAEARHTRRIRVAVGTDTVDLTLDGARLERPALAADGSTVRLAALAITPDGATVVTATSSDGGRAWSALAPLPGAASPNVPPAWDGAAVVWVDGGRVCRAVPGDPAPACVAAGSPRVASLSVRDGVATIVRDEGVAEWALAELRW